MNREKEGRNIFQLVHPTFWAEMIAAARPAHNVESPRKGVSHLASPRGTTTALAQIFFLTTSSGPLLQSLNLRQLVRPPRRNATPAARAVLASVLAILLAPKQMVYVFINNCAPASAETTAARLSAALALATVKTSFVNLQALLWLW